MKEAFGGILNLVLIVTFLLIVMGVLGLTVSYSKAFRMKNKVISRIEQYEGSTSCFSPDGKCFEMIKQDAAQLGYSPSIALSCDNNMENYFCYNVYTVSDETGNQIRKKYKFKNYSYDGTTTEEILACEAL